jgi:hypothetical protein
MWRWIKALFYKEIEVPVYSKRVVDGTKSVADGFHHVWRTKQEQKMVMGPITRYRTESYTTWGPRGPNYHTRSVPYTSYELQPKTVDTSGYVLETKYKDVPVHNILVSSGDGEYTIHVQADLWYGASQEMEKIGQTLVLKRICGIHFWKDGTKSVHTTIHRQITWRTVMSDTLCFMGILGAVLGTVAAGMYGVRRMLEK